METPKLFLIKTTFGEFGSFKELQEYADAQYLTLQNTLATIKDQEQEIAHLKELLVATTKIVDDHTQRIIKTPAECACEEQIERIQKDSMVRTLALDEVKKLDLLIKNLRLLKGDSTIINGESKKRENQEISIKSLMEIASTPETKQS